MVGHGKKAVGDQLISSESGAAGGGGRKLAAQKPAADQPICSADQVRRIDPLWVPGPVPSRFWEDRQNRRNYYYSAKLILLCLGNLAKLVSCRVKEDEAWMPNRFADCSRCLRNL
jgi:hypothetical protein